MMLLTYTNPNGQSFSFGTGQIAGTSDVEGIDSPPLDVQVQKAPFQDGDTLIDQLYQPRDVAITGALLDKPRLFDIYTIRSQMLTACNPKLGPGILTVQKDNATRILTALPDPGPIFKWKPGNEPWQQYQVTFHCDDPYFYDQTPTVFTFSVSIAAFSFPVGVGWAWPVAGAVFSTQAPNSTLIVNNTGMVFTPIQAVLSGPATNPSINNLTSGQFMKFTTTLALGDTIAFSSAFGQKTATLTRAGTGAVNAMGLLATGSTFWTLGLGNNSVKFSDDSGTATGTLTLTYSNRYVGM